MKLTKSYPILTDITLPVPLINYNHFHPPPSLLVKIVTFIYRKQRDIAATNSPKRSEIQSAPSGDLPGTTDPSISMIISWLIYFHSVRLPEPDPRQPSIQSTVRPHPSRRVGGNSSGGGNHGFLRSTPGTPLDSDSIRDLWQSTAGDADDDRLKISYVYWDGLLSQLCAMAQRLRKQYPKMNHRRRWRRMRLATETAGSGSTFDGS